MRAETAYYLSALRRRIARPIGDILERCLLRRRTSSLMPPIIVIGPARSGTTLVYQCLAQGLRLSYLPNIAALFPECPVLATRAISCFRALDPPHSFYSRYGSTPGWLAPNQGNRIWGHWFARDAEQLVLSEDDIRRIRRVVGGLQEAGCAPFATKWPGFSVYLPYVAQALPEALFVRVRRDASQVAQSVLKGRRELHGDPLKGISRNPRLYKNFKSASYIEQVCAYVIGVEQDINRDAEAVGRDAFYEVRYEGLCADPGGVLDAFAHWYADKAGIVLKRRYRLPAEFPCSTARKVEYSEAVAIDDCLARLGGQQLPPECPGAGPQYNGQVGGDE